MYGGMDVDDGSMCMRGLALLLKKCKMMMMMRLLSVLLLFSTVHRQLSPLSLLDSVMLSLAKQRDTI